MCARRRRWSRSFPRFSISGAPKRARINDLEAKAIAQDKRLRELEDNQVKDCSVWRPDRVYGRGSMRAFATHMFTDGAVGELDDDVGDIIDGAREWDEEAMAEWRLNFRRELEALPFKFPLRVTLKGFDERKRLSDAAGHSAP